MKRHGIACLLLASSALVLPPIATAQEGPDSYIPGTMDFSMRTVAADLAGPWEITLGPDGMLWVTERTGKRISRIDPETGEQTVAITIDEVSAPGGQDGLLGLALHPELGQGTGNDYVYAAYTYVDEEKGADPTVTDQDSPYLTLYTKLVQLTYNEADGTLSDPVDLITGLPAGNDHNSGRLKFGPDGKLYYTIGEGGHNQGSNVCLPIEAQRLPTQAEIEAKDYVAYVGKSLRLNPDGSIPEDNPALDGVTSHVYTYGHRNMQGIDFGPDGTLYASEHGPKTDDEVNILVPGGNYGWPNVAGFIDGMAYVRANWELATNPPCEETEFSEYEIPENVPQEPESAFTQEMVEPLVTLFTVPTGYQFVDPKCEGIDFICWPTVGISSIEYYEGGEDRIPGWDKVLITPTLKRGSLYIVPLDESGQQREGKLERYFQTENRYRDIAVSPDGRTIYVSTDPTGLAESEAGGTTSDLANPGQILAFTYEGEGEAAAAEPAAPAADDAAADEPAEAPADQSAAPAGDLPSFTAEQVAAGEAAYQSTCSVCHGKALDNGTYAPPLAGPAFAAKWNGRPVTDLVAKVHTMPPTAAGSLSDAVYAQIVAYILAGNGFEAGDTELTETGEGSGTINLQ